MTRDSINRIKPAADKEMPGASLQLVAGLKEISSNGEFRAAGHCTQ
jgi:hypothetical protein